MKRIEVAVGIVFNDRSQVLVGQRTVKDLYFEKWEFPGGKLELGETVAQALRREFKEEIGIDVLASEHLLDLEHDYPDRQVRLHIHTITDYSGQVRGLEGQALQWVAIDELNQLDFLAGNQAIIEALEQLDAPCTEL